MSLRCSPLREDYVWCSGHGYITDQAIRFSMTSGAPDPRLLSCRFPAKREFKTIDLFAFRLVAEGPVDAEDGEFYRYVRVLFQPPVRCLVIRSTGEVGSGEPPIHLAQFITPEELISIASAYEIKDHDALTEVCGLTSLPGPSGLQDSAPDVAEIRYRIRIVDERLRLLSATILSNMAVKSADRFRSPLGINSMQAYAELHAALESLSERLALRTPGFDQPLAFTKALHTLRKHIADCNLTQDIEHVDSEGATANRRYRKRDRAMQATSLSLISDLRELIRVVSVRLDSTDGTDSAQQTPSALEPSRNSSDQDRLVEPLLHGEQPPITTLETSGPMPFDGKTQPGPTQGAHVDTSDIAEKLEATNTESEPRRESAGTEPYTNDTAEPKEATTATSEASCHALPAAYADSPKLFARDEWLYGQRKQGKTIPAILKALEWRAEAQGWPLLTNEGSIRDRSNHYAKAMGLPRAKGKAGNPVNIRKAKAKREP